MCVYERKRNNNANVYNDAHAYDGASAYINYHACANANNNASRCVEISIRRDAEKELNKLYEKH